MKKLVVVVTLLMIVGIFLEGKAQRSTIPNAGGASIGLQGQAAEYSENEFLILYSEGVLPEEKEAIRSSYQIDHYEAIGERIEFWYEISFPIPQTDSAGNYHEIHSIHELLEEFETQNGVDAQQNDERSHVNGGGFNYNFEIPGVLLDEPTSSANLLPFCPDEISKIIGQPGNNTSDPIKIVLIDDQVQNLEYFNNLIIYSFLTTFSHGTGGQPTGNETSSHADQVGSVIKNSLFALGIDFQLINIPVFDETGTSDLFKLLKAFQFLNDHGIDNAIINLSSRIVSGDAEFSNKLWDYVNDILVENNLLLVSSSGNDGQINQAVFPGSAGMSHEITVVGTSNCLSELWPLSNTNQFEFEIAAEAEGILILSGENEYRLGHGTSYSAALVTGVAAQITTHHPDFDAITIKNQLLSSADHQPSLMSAVQGGRVLNAMSATYQDMSLQTSQALNLRRGLLEKNGDLEVLPKISPNPFTDELSIKLPFSERGNFTRISMNTISGHQLFTQDILGSSDLVLSSLGEFPPGIYLISICTENGIYTEKIVKVN